jgi:hypothetical protein
MAVQFSVIKVGRKVDVALRVRSRSQVSSFVDAAYVGGVDGSPAVGVVEGALSEVLEDDAVILIVIDCWREEDGLLHIVRCASPVAHGEQLAGVAAVVALPGIRVLEEHGGVESDGIAVMFGRTGIAASVWHEVHHAVGQDGSRVADRVQAANL